MNDLDKVQEEIIKAQSMIDDHVLKATPESATGECPQAPAIREAVSRFLRKLGAIMASNTEPRK